MKTVKHGTRYRYAKGCRCDDCSEAERLYHRDYRLRGGGSGVPIRNTSELSQSETPGPVESAVTTELAGYPLSAERPGLTAVAVCLAQLLDNSKAVAAHPSAARELGKVLDTLSKRSQRPRKLAVVKSMTTSSPSP
jgi:hypothetical protein